MDPSPCCRTEAVTQLLDAAPQTDGEAELSPLDLSEERAALGHWLAADQLCGAHNETLFSATALVPSSRVDICLIPSYCSFPQEFKTSYKVHGPSTAAPMGF